MLNIYEDPAVEKWLSTYDKALWRNRVSCLGDFLRYLREKGFESATPSGLLEFQRKAAADGREYELLDLLQQYIFNKKGTYNSLQTRHSHIRMFFKRNRVPLPDDVFEIRANREPVQGRLSVDVIRCLLDSVDLGFKAFYLSLWMGIMDCERFIQFNVKYGYDLGEHLKSKGVDEPFKIDFPGRKRSKNRTIYHTYLGRDALSVWREYFERIRGYPQEGEAALIDIRGRPISKVAIRHRHMRVLVKLNYINDRGNESSTRYGYHLHDFRDEAKTLLHLQGKRDGLDLECVDFWMGHVTDPNHYDKFFRDKSYTLEMYRIAERYLNIVSGVGLTPTGNIDEMIEQLVLNGPACLKLVKAIEHHSGLKLGPIEK